MKQIRRSYLIAISVITVVIFALVVTTAHASGQEAPDKLSVTTGTLSENTVTATLVPDERIVVATTDETGQITVTTFDKTGITITAISSDEKVGTLALISTGEYFAQHTAIKNGGAAMRAEIAGFTFAPDQAHTYPGQPLTITT